MKKKKTLALCVVIAIALSTGIFGQTGGDFSLTQTVIAGGGGTSAGGDFTLGATIGQPFAGRAAASPFGISGGFWNSTLLAPTAAQVSIGGRALTADGRGIRNARVTLTAANGETRTAQTGFFGFYRFTNVTVGETYILTIQAKRFTFSQPTVVRTVLDEIYDLDFIADPFNYRAISSPN
jgi:hypothetical protein